MTYVEKVKGAVTPMEALLLLAQGLDDAVLMREAPDPWAGWSNPEMRSRIQALHEAEAPLYERLAASEAEDRVLYNTAAQPLVSVVDVNRDERLIKLAKPTESKLLQRRQYAETVLKLDTVLLEAPAGLTWPEVYAKGGPMWLYTGNREIFMSYPINVRQAMVADIEEDDPETAQEVGRDVLKAAGETGPGSVAMQMAG